MEREVRSTHVEHVAEEPRTAKKSEIIAAYLQACVPEFAQLCIARKNCQRMIMDLEQRHRGKSLLSLSVFGNLSAETQRNYFDKMFTIAAELNDNTSCFTFNATNSGSSEDNATINKPKVLDLCLAPGGFVGYLLSKYPGAQVCGLTLAPSRGGRQCLVEQSDLVQITYTDITLHDFRLDPDSPLPPSATREAIESNTPLPDLSNEEFGLILCDGQKFRDVSNLPAPSSTLSTPVQMERPWEASRLLVSQLIIGLPRIHQGGTVVVLSHKLETWRLASLVFKFDSFSEVTLYRPRSDTTIRSSFYMIAKNVDRAKATAWTHELRHSWYDMTFSGLDGRGSGLAADLLPDVSGELFTEIFGAKFITLGGDIWSTQLEMLNLAAGQKGIPLDWT